MTVQRISAGVPTGGQFATSVRSEASLALAPEPVVRPERDETAAVTDVLVEVESLISRETLDGSYTPTARHGDVADAVREHVPNLGDEDFDAHMDRIAKAAEIVSIVESAEAGDIDVYEEFAAEGGIDVDDFPAGPDREPGDGYHDLDAYRSAVISHYDNEVHSAAAAMVAADTHAAV